LAIQAFFVVQVAEDKMVPLVVLVALLVVEARGKMAVEVEALLFALVALLVVEVEDKVAALFVLVVLMAVRAEVEVLVVVV
jgi:hypothetical protein